MHVPIYLCRSIILMVIAIAAGMTICLENPQNSLIGMHEKFIWLVRLLMRHNISVSRGHI